MTPLQTLEKTLKEVNIPYYIEESDNQEEQVLYFSKSWDSEGYLMYLNFSHDIYVPDID